jgi:hypothetical protein
MLYVPFVVGASVGANISLPLILLLLSSTFLFIARESLLVCARARSRGQRIREAESTLLIYAALAVISGAPLALFYHLYILVPAGALAALLLVVNAQQAVRREDRTVLGEGMAILGLTMTAPMAYVAARLAWDVTALYLWALCALYFTSSIFYVKLRVYSIAKRKQDERRKTWWRCAVYHISLLALLVAGMLLDHLSLFALVAFAPVLTRSFWHLAKPASQINLKRVGWTEMVYSLVFLIFITLTFRVSL